MMKKTIFLILAFFVHMLVSGQVVDNNQIKSMVKQFKSDAKGPYLDIRWFCIDGTTRPPKDRCPEPGVQRARYKAEVVFLGQTNHLFLGQILAATDVNSFWDARHFHSRLKQYQVEKYLRRNDNGWILQKAQYYRGAFQAEDEENWGKEFYSWLLADANQLEDNFYLIRESAKDIPHQGDDNKTQLIRSLSKELSDSLSDFQNIRVKIHGQPEVIDIQTVNKYLTMNRSRLNADQIKKMELLIGSMEIVFQPADMNSLKKYIKVLAKDEEINAKLQSFSSSYANWSGQKKVMELAQMLWMIRQEMPNATNSSSRLAMLDLSINLEEILFRELKSWQDITLSDLISKTYYLGLAAAGSGYLEQWEWEKIKPQLEPPTGSGIVFEDLYLRLEVARRMLEWSVGSTRGIYKDVVDQFQGFEPMAYGFYDDRVRSTCLLYLGNCVSDLAEFIAQEANLSNMVMDIEGQGHFRGINPGYAMGELVVLNDITDEVAIYADKIYVFNHPPADLKPVAGIATVTEGNMVSHVQLLARNLGIPNAVLSADNLESLKKYSGQQVFYAVSNQGTVIMKPASKMTTVEKKLFETKKRNAEKIRVPVDRIDLNQSRIINLRQVNAKHSGLLCGPKAANLGQLKMMFPEYVVEGFVIPFGIFKDHMDQMMSGKKMSYWDYVNSIFDQAENMQLNGSQEAEVDSFVLTQLKILRDEIKVMPLKPAFVADLESSFTTIFGKGMGEVPVFLRSDTNMEDLEDFTGAGLNLTLFNVVNREKIMQGIKDVWASPYSERSYKWRQSYLLNPENVYPSILVIPSVDVDYSGVLITKGIMTDNNNDLTIAFSRGAGGAVDGQFAESYLLLQNGESILLSPSREAFSNTLPLTGGTGKRFSSFRYPILSDKNLDQIRLFSQQIKYKLVGESDNSSANPFDIELGFKEDKIWLFQVRPFVENKNAIRSDYLKSISPPLPLGKQILMSTLL